MRRRVCIPVLTTRTTKYAVTLQFIVSVRSRQYFDGTLAPLLTRACFTKENTATQKSPESCGSLCEHPAQVTNFTRDRFDH